MSIIINTIQTNRLTNVHCTWRFSEIKFMIQPELNIVFCFNMGCDSSVGIATCYGLDSPGIKPSGGEILHTHPDWPWDPPNLLYNGHRVFPSGKVAVVWCWPPTQSTAEFKERVELYLYSTSEPLWPVLGWTLFQYISAYIIHYI
jgi:hypothetical protein